MLHIHVSVYMNDGNCNLVWKYKDSFPKSTHTFVSESMKLIWASGSFSTSMSLPYKPYLSCNLIGESQSFKYVSQILPTPYWNSGGKLLALCWQVLWVISTGEVVNGINLVSVFKEGCCRFISFKTIMQKKWPVMKMIDWSERG